MSATVSTELPRSPHAGAGAVRPEPHVIVLFGAGGDLAARKLLPGFFHLQSAGLLPERWRIVGTAEQDYHDAGFREHARSAVSEHGRDGVAEREWAEFEQRLSYVPVAAGEGPLADAVTGARSAVGEGCRLLHYLAVPPAAFGAITAELGELDLTGP